MTDPEELYRSFLLNGSFLNRMLQCGGRANFWLEHALVNFVPQQLFEEWKEKVAFVSTANSDAYRIAIKTRQRELIFISEHIIPPKGAAEDHPEVRYFIFVALHELIHVVKQHSPPDEISRRQSEVQEEEADSLALDWFNAYIKSTKNPHLKQLTGEEIQAAQEKNRRRMEALQ